MILKAGTDYVIKELNDITNHDDSWAILPDNSYTREYRHDWIFKRNRRPMDPTFSCCPMPRRHDENQDSNAALIMTYFHPFTLNPELEDTYVPFLGNLCTIGKTWQASLLYLFGGRILCAETKKHLDNFLAVTEARPEEEHDERSDEEMSDEELVIDRLNFADVIEARMGSGLKNKTTVS